MQSKTLSQSHKESHAHYDAESHTVTIIHTVTHSVTHSHKLVFEKDVHSHIRSDTEVFMSLHMVSCKTYQGVFHMVIPSP